MIQDNPDVIQPIFDEVKKNFQSQKSKSKQYRITQLKQLLKGMNELDQEFHDALKQDLGMTQFQSQLYSTVITKVDIQHAIDHLSTWMKPKQVDTPFIIGPASSKIVYEPYGVVVVLGAWNYPVYLTIPPMAAAIAAGNAVVIKPSELAPCSSRILKKLVTNYLDQDLYRVIEGAVQVATKIITIPWDLIIFTGSPEKGKLVAKAAAENLVPCILELGGKSPTIVDQTANLSVSAQRIVQGRFTNAGQTCIACDYLLVQESIVPQFTQELKKAIISQFGVDAMTSDDFSRIVTAGHTERLKKMIDVQDHKGELIYGGGSDVQGRYIEPTLILKPDLNSKVMTEEIFGPILPILTYKNIEEVIEFINQRPKPLALYYFGSDNKVKKLLETSTSSGALCFNDALFHLLNPDLPFGGVGNSGYSAYHGISGFLSCSHAKPIFDKSTLNCYPFNSRYPPFTSHKKFLMNTFFKFASLSQRTVQNTVIIASLLLAANYLRKNARVQDKIQEVKPLVKEIVSKLLSRN